MTERGSKPVCSCTEPGWCERHQVKKTAHWVHLCQTREDYRELWDEGRGPGQLHTGTDAASEKPTKAAATPGPGTELRKILGCCNCSFAARMNEWGPDVCLERIEEIIGWLTERGKMSDHAARRMIPLAVERSRSALVDS